MSDLKSQLLSMVTFDKSIKVLLAWLENQEKFKERKQLVSKYPPLAGNHVKENKKRGKWQEVQKRFIYIFSDHGGYLPNMQILASSTLLIQPAQC